MLQVGFLASLTPARVRYIINTSVLAPKVKRKAILELASVAVTIFEDLISVEPFERA